MKVLNHLPLDVESARLNAPPEGATRLASSGRLLVMWQYGCYILDLESDEAYYLALYHPDYGWRACRWDKAHGAPFDVRPTSESAIWVSTDEGKLIHISVGKEVRATMSASGKGNRFHLLYSDLDDLWIREHASATIMQLRLQKDGLTTVAEKRVPFYTDAMYPLADGVWMITGEYYSNSCVILSPSFGEKIYETRSNVSLHSPFLVQVGQNHYSYTEDPRRGWKKMPMGVKDVNGSVVFFAKQDDVYYVAICRRSGEEKTVLYRFWGASETDAECMWEISGYLHTGQFALCNGLVGIVGYKPLVVSSREDGMENHRFLVWDPLSNAFYRDIPQFSIMHSRHIVPRSLKIPAAWSGRENAPHMLDIQ